MTITSHKHKHATISMYEITAADGVYYFYMVDGLKDQEFATLAEAQAAVDGFESVLAYDCSEVD